MVSLVRLIPGDPNRDIRPEFSTKEDYRVWGECLKLAELAYYYGPFSKYNHYHTIKVSPPWSKGKIPNAIINNHKFFVL